MSGIYSDNSEYAKWKEFWLWSSTLNQVITIIHDLKNSPESGFSATEDLQTFYGTVGQDSPDFFRYNLAKEYLIKSLFIPVPWENNGASYFLSCTSIQQEYEEQYYDNGLQLIAFKKYSDYNDCHDGGDQDQRYYSCGTYLVTHSNTGNDASSFPIPSFLKNSNYGNGENRPNARGSDVFISDIVARGLSGTCDRRTNYYTYYHSTSIDTLRDNDKVGLGNWNNFPVQIVSFSLCETGQGGNEMLEVFMCLKFFCSKKISQVYEDKPYYNYTNEKDRKPLLVNSDTYPPHERLRFNQYRNFLFTVKSVDGTQHKGINVSGNTEQVGHSKFYKISEEMKIIAFSTLPKNNQNPDSDVPPEMPPPPSFKYDASNMKFEGGYPLCLYVYNGNESKEIGPELLLPFSDILNQQNPSNVTKMYAPDISSFSLEDKLFIDDNLAFFNKVCWSEYLMENALKKAFKERSEIAIVYGKSEVQKNSENVIKYNHKIFLCRYALDFKDGSNKKLIQVGEDELKFDSDVILNNKDFPIQNFSLSQNGQVLLYDDVAYFIVIPPFKPLTESVKIKAIKMARMRGLASNATDIDVYKKLKHHVWSPAITSFYGTKFLVANYDQIFYANAMTGEVILQQKALRLSTEHLQYLYFYTYPSERFKNQKDYIKSNGVIDIIYSYISDTDGQKGRYTKPCLCFVPYSLTDNFTDLMKIRAPLFAGAFSVTNPIPITDFTKVKVPSETIISDSVLKMYFEIYITPTRFFSPSYDALKQIFDKALMNTFGTTEINYCYIGLDKDGETLTLTADKKDASLFAYPVTYNGQSTSTPHSPELILNGVKTVKFISKTENGILKVSNYGSRNVLVSIDGSKQNIFGKLFPNEELGVLTVDTDGTENSKLYPTFLKSGRFKVFNQGSNIFPLD